ncbi:hypothetical protein [Arthrobacter sp. Z1-9]
MKATIKRLYFAAVASLGLVVAAAITAAPAIAGTRLNHTEPQL